MNTSVPSRRTVLATAGAASAAVSLAACGGSGDAPEGGASQETGDQPSSGSGHPDGGVLVETSEVPEGGGTILKEQKVVVTQPSAGEFRAFSAVCTHRGCLVSSVEDGTVNCSCHGSRFAIGDGSVTQGPATQALPAVDVSVTGGVVRRA